MPRNYKWFLTVVLPVYNDDKVFRTHFRVSRATFFYICGAVGSSLQCNSPRAGLCVEEQVAVCLSFLASGTNFEQVGAMHGFSRTTVHRWVQAVIGMRAVCCSSVQRKR